MNKRPAGYVYQPYPKMIYNDAWKPLGYKIVKSEQEHQDVLKTLVPIDEVKSVDSTTVEKKSSRKKLKFDME